MSEQIKKVLCNVTQDLSNPEKAKARANIDAVSSSELADSLATKQDTLTAGDNISISAQNEISATDTTYSAGSGLSLNGTQFSVDTTTIQSKLTAGQNVSIGDVGGVLTISATDTTYSAGTGLALNGTTFSNSAPNVKSDWNAAAGSSAEILHKPTIPTKTSELNNDSGFITAAQVPGAANNGKLTINQGPYLIGEFTADQAGNTTVDVERYLMPSGIGLDVTTSGNSNTHETTFMADVLYSTGLRITSDNELAVKMKAGGHVSADSDGIYVPNVVLHDTFGAYPVAYSYATETPVSIMGGAATLSLAYAPAAPGSSSNWSPVTFYLTLTNTAQMFYVTSKLYDETQVGVVLTGSGASPNGNKTNLTTLMTGTGPSLSSSDNSERVELDIYILSNASYLEPLRHAHVTINRVYQTPSGASGTGPLIFVSCEYEDTI